MRATGLTGLASPVDGFGATGRIPALPASSYPLKKIYLKRGSAHLKILDAKSQMWLTASLTPHETLDSIAFRVSDPSFWRFSEAH